MRWMRFSVVLMLLLPCHLKAQQYSEAVCLLLQQQIDRYADQRSNPNYRSARREYDKYCYTRPAKKPLPVQAEDSAALPTEIPQPETVTTNTSPEPAPTETAALAEQAITPETTDAQVSGEHSALENSALENTTGSIKPSMSAVAQPVAQTYESAVAATAQDTAVADNKPAQAVETGATKPAGSGDAIDETLDETLDINALLMDVLFALPLVSANIVAFLLVVFLVTNWLGLNLPGFKGVFAEYKLNRLLRWRLSKQYQHFRKLRLTNDNNETVVIDHLLLSPFGIFVIMVKSYRGRINGSESQANWTRDYFGNNKQFMNPLHQNFKNLQALKQLLELADFELLHSVIAFARVGQLASDLPANITYVDTTSRYIKQCSEPCISEEQLARFAAVIQQAVQ